MARIAGKNIELREDSAVGIARVYLPDDLVIVVPELLKLEVKVVQPGNKLNFRRVASDDYELFGDNAFDYKMAAVILRSGLAERAVPLSDKGTRSARLGRSPESNAF